MSLYLLIQTFDLFLPFTFEGNVKKDEKENPSVKKMVSESKGKWQLFFVVNNFATTLSTFDFFEIFSLPLSTLLLYCLFNSFLFGLFLHLFPLISLTPQEPWIT